MNKEHEEPSVYTIIFWLIQDKKINSETLFRFLEFYWPTFIEKDKCVFLKEKFCEEEYARLVTQKENPEFWINLLTVDDFFSEVASFEKKSESFAKMLIEIWEAKLKRDFPDKNFIVKYVCDEEYGDYGLTFYQKKLNIVK